MNRYLAGVDIGGTHVKTLVVDDGLQPCGYSTVPAATDSVDAVVETVANAIEDVIADSGISLSDLDYIGVGVPGQVDTQDGIVRHAVNLNIEEAPLAALLTERLGRPVAIDNDVITATIGAFNYLNPDKVEDFCYLNIGTGVSAGLFLDGRLHRGQHGMAGEIGHMVIVDDGLVCPCGNRGCLEAYVSGPAIATPPLTTAAVYQAAAAGDPAAREIVQTAGRHLGRALQNLMMAYDVGKIVLGGGVTRSGSLFLDPILQEWATQANRSPLAALMLRPAILSLAPPDFNAGVWGAIVIARQRRILSVK